MSENTEAPAMSWITDLAGRAEHLLNKLDIEAATVLSKERSDSNSVTTKSPFKYNAANAIPQPPRYESKSNLQSSSSVPSNLSTYGLGGSSVPPPATYHAVQGTSLTSSPKATSKKGLVKVKKEHREEGLMDYLNSPVDLEGGQPPAATIAPQPDSMISSTMTTSTLSSLGHSRQSSVSSVSSFMALSGRETPGSATVDIETGSSGSGSGGSANTDAYVTVDTPTDVNISAPPSTDGSTSSNGIMSASVDSEISMLRKEVSSLNQEMSQVLRRAKDAEKETIQLRAQVSGLLSQQSSSDRIMRDVQQREMDLQESLRAKDSQLAVLRVRLQEGDDQVKVKERTISHLQEENKRLLEGVNESSGLHNHAIQTVQDRLADAQDNLDRERHLHSTSQAELTRRVSQLEEEQQGMATALTEAQRKLEEERNKAHHLTVQINTLRGDLTSSREELTEYKAKAGRILQSKEKLIASLKEERGSGMEGDPENQLYQAELHQIRDERDLMREEMEGAGVQIRQLMAEITELESNSQDQATVSSQNAASLEESLSDERKRRTETDVELRQMQEELRCAHEELSRQKVNLSTRVQERDTEIDRLRKQVAHKQSSSSSQSELEQRLHGLTESLIHKQNNIETLSTEKHSLIIQMERLQQQYQESQTMLNRDQPTAYRQDDVRNRVPTFLMESPFDGGMARQVKRAYTTLDKFSVRLGVFLRRYPIARVFVILYMCLLHVWVMIVLLTYTPEIHGSDFHRPVGTMPHIAMP